MVDYDGQKSRFEIDAREVLLHNGRHNRLPIHGRIRLSIRSRVQDLQPGMTLMVLAKIGRITNFKTPGTFDYKGYMAAGNIYVSGWIKDRQSILQVQDQARTRPQQLRYLPEQIRQKVAGFLDQRLDNNISALYQALLVGSRAQVNPEVLERFKITGTMHLLAISGIHMGLLGLIIGTLLNRLLRRSEWLLLHFHVPGLALIGTLPILVGYAFIAGMNTPVLRALIMATILLTAVLLRREHSLLHLVSAAALLVVLCNPLALFTVSFQLSFAAVTALALFFPELTRLVQRDDNRPGNTTRIKDYPRLALLVSLTATLGTLPFMLYHFNRFSLIGPVMNLLVEPLLCFWALPWGLVAIPLMFTAPQAAVLLLKIGGLGITAGQYITAMGASIPFASIRTITPSIPEIGMYVLLFLLWRFSSQAGPAKKIVLLAGLLLAAHFTKGIWFPEKPKFSRITYLDVGQGSSTFIHIPDGSRILIDGGGSRNGNFNVGERIIAPFLRHQRIWRIDKAIITHPHSDHFNGMDFIFKHFQPETVYINGDRRGEGNYSQLIEQARYRKIKIAVPEAGQEIVTGVDFELNVLGMNGPAMPQNGQVNDRCLVLKYRHAERAFLFPADISTRSEGVLIKNGANLRADVLLAAHHGSSTSNSASFLEAVNPSIIVVSAGKNGQAHYPAPDNLALWKQKKLRTYITRDQGTITCTTDGQSLQCSGYSPL
jgi:competence protein ComEC